MLGAVFPLQCRQHDCSSSRKVAGETSQQAIVETAGVGYDVTISIPTFSDLPGVGSEVSLHIHTHVREDLIGLYGFLRLGEKQLFEKLITVSGIGPKLAITILSGMPADEMVGAIRGNDIARLTRIPGIGRKTAERMVLELRDKLPPQAIGQEPAVPVMSPIEEDVFSALLNLDTSARRRKTASAVKAGKAGSFDLLFREALGGLSK
jgi:Holliday junction DNA helicase RuvA